MHLTLSGLQVTQEGHNWLCCHRKHIPSSGICSCGSCTSNQTITHRKLKADLHMPHAVLYDDILSASQLEQTSLLWRTFCHAQVQDDLPPCLNTFAIATSLRSIGQAWWSARPAAASGVVACAGTSTRAAYLSKIKAQRMSVAPAAACFWI